LLLAYALELDPAAIKPNALPQATLEENHLALRFHGQRPNIGYRVEWSEDLLMWDDDQVLLSDPDGSGMRTAKVTMEGRPQAFLRVVVWEN